MQVPQSIALRHFFFCRPLSDFVSVRPYRFTEISDTPDSTSSTDVSLRTHFSSSTRLHFMPANSPSAAKREISFKRAKAVAAHRILVHLLQYLP